MSVTNWITNREVEDIEGALRPSTYIARAYRHVKENDGIYPEWAKKSENGRWLLDSSYILLDARQNLKTMSVGEAAKLLGASRRAVQNWVDIDLILTVDIGTKDRRINREQFMRDIPALRARLETPAVIGYKLRYGGEVSDEQILKAEDEKELKRKKALERNKIRRREKRKALREVERSTGYYAELKKASEAKKNAEAERKLATKKTKDKVFEEREAVKREGQVQAAAKLKLKAIGQAKKKALKAIEREEQREAKLRSIIRKELEEARQAKVAASKEKKVAFAEAKLRSAKEKEMLAKEVKLKERRREQKRKEQRRKEKQSKERKMKRIKVRTVADIEIRLKEGQEKRLADVKWRKQAVAIAERIRDNMLDNDLSQIDAVLMFNDLSEEEGIPREIHTAVRKDIIGR